MPSALKARSGRPSFAEMKADLDQLRKPTAAAVERLHAKYHGMCMAEDPPLTEIEVVEPAVNWKALIMSLPRPRSSEVLGVGIRKILLKETECVYQGIYRFHVLRLDGTDVMFEWRDAFDDAYHGFKDKSFKDHVETALRAAVLPHLIEFKEMLAKDSQVELSSHISGVALPWDRAVVQHFPTTLETLVDAFLNEHQLKIEQVKLDYCDQHVYKILDEMLLAKWQSFHKHHAHYRVISTEEGMEQGNL